MSIVPLPVFEADADPARRSVMSDREIYARLQPPKTMVVRFGYLRIVGEFSYDGDAKPGCGSKLVIRTLRGTEIAEMLTTTCSNSGCGKSVSRREMLDYIENSGGKDFPFHTKGKILRVATIEDLNRQSELDVVRRDAVKVCKALIVELGLPMKLVEAEPILGQEQITFYYMSEDRIDFRELVQRLAGHFHTRIEMRQVGARDEARLVADYERCGQHCCCKNFLKVLKPVSMRAAKVQKATLDPLKISGRCGRLMCCLRYEDQTYKELKAKLPPKNKRVGTTEGPGVVVDSKILVQLALVRLEHNGKEIAVPIEELLDPEKCPKPRSPADEAEAGGFASDPLRGLSPEQAKARTEDRRGPERRGRNRQDQSGAKSARPAKSRHEQQDAYRQRSQAEEAGQGDGGEASSAEAANAGSGGQAGDQTKRRKRRRGKRPTDGRVETGGQSDSQHSSGAGEPVTDASPPSDHAADGQARKRRRRRRKRRGPQQDGGSGSPPPPSA